MRNINHNAPTARRALLLAAAFLFVPLSLADMAGFVAGFLGRADFAAIARVTRTTPGGLFAQEAPLANPQGGREQTESPNVVMTDANSTPSGTLEMADERTQTQSLPLPEPAPLVLDLPLAQGTMGAEAWYYEAKRLERNVGTPGVQAPMAAAQPPAELPSTGYSEIEQRSIDFMYSLAFHFGEKAAAKEAGKALLQRLETRPDKAAHRQTASQWLDYFGPDWDIYKSLIIPALAGGDYAYALETIATLRVVAPSIAKAKASELAWYEYSARAALGDYAWHGAAMTLAKAASLDAWASKSLRLAAAAPDLDATTREMFLMRADYHDRDYGQAARHATGAAPLILAKGAPRILLSEAGKSFINAGAAVDGASFMLAFFPEVSASDPAVDLPDALGSVLSARGRDENAWVAAYYVGRLWMSAGKEREAAILFLALTDNAPSDADADSALWYWLDITMRRVAAEDIAAFDASEPAHNAAPSTNTNTNANADATSDGSSPTNAPPEPANAEPPRNDASAETVPNTTQPAPNPAATVATAKRSLELGALLEASTRWKNPAYFADIVEAYDRSLLRGKAWNEVLALCALIGDRVSPDTKTRLLYQSGRLVEENLAANQSTDAPTKDIAAAYFKRITETPKVEEYYRTMASWRLGLDPPYLAAMPDLSKQAQPPVARLSAEVPQTTPTTSALYVPSQTPPAQTAANGNGVQSALLLIRNYLLYGLDEMASSLALKYIGGLDVSAIVGLAFDLSAEGQHYAALRLARDALNRGAGAQYPELYGLVYPKAWNDIVTRGAAIPKIPEALAYGIIRSESVFDPKAVSYAGAVGLTQLMPSTAAETAKGLKMADYSLTDPADNVKIGLTYYSYMLARFGEKPMRAMFAYNAGPGRMTTWAKESGELPDDLLLETLSIEQPRQYAKNIILSSLAFGKIHYGIEPKEMLAYLVNARPLPEAEAPRIAPPTPAEPASSPPPSPEPSPLMPMAQPENPSAQ